MLQPNKNQLWCNRKSGNISPCYNNQITIKFRWCLQNPIFVYIHISVSSYYIRKITRNEGWTPFTLIKIMSIQIETNLRLSECSDNTTMLQWKWNGNWIKSNHAPFVVICDMCVFEFNSEWVCALENICDFFPSHHLDESLLTSFHILLSHSAQMIMTITTMIITVVAISGTIICLLFVIAFATTDNLNLFHTLNCNNKYTNTTKYLHTDTDVDIIIYLSIYLY